MRPTTLLEPAAPAIAVCTIGYEGTSIESLLGTLRRHRIRRLIDVRELPLSRKPGFSKTPLSSALNAIGIGYQHVRALGCPKPIRDRYRADHDWQRYTRAFEGYLAGQRETVALLRIEVERAPACLLCVEADAGRCHRSIVARALAADSALVIVHLAPPPA